LSGEIEPRFGEALGWLYVRSYPWVYFSQRGWRYVQEAGISNHANAWWFYDSVIGWFWTTRDLYPWIYRLDIGWTQEVVAA
jgi:hypothetical protein